MLNQRIFFVIGNTLRRIGLCKHSSAAIISGSEAATYLSAWRMRTATHLVERLVIVVVVSHGSLTALTGGAANFSTLLGWVRHLTGSTLML